MNSNKSKLANAARNVKSKAVAAGAVVASAAGSAMAGGGGGGFDTTAITSAITSYTAAAVAVIGAFAVGVWSLRAMGLLKRG